PTGRTIDEWTREALALSSTDPPMCTVLTKSLSLMDTVEKEGVSASGLGFTLAYINSERGLLMNLDQKKSDPLRYVIYGMTESLETMVNSLMTRSNGENSPQCQPTLSIDEWTQHALSLSRTDPPLGTLLIKSLRLMDAVEKEGAASSLQCAVSFMPSE
ncbi:hypothetical protein PMAYCL1PPCAC_14117, partial [Pristionchus mayeri]